MAAINPGLLVDVLDLEIENILVDIAGAMNAVCLDQFGQVGYCLVQHGASLRCAVG